MDHSLDAYVGRPHESVFDLYPAYDPDHDPASASAGAGLSSRLDDGFFVELWRLAYDVQLPPEWLLEIFYLESGLNPNVPANPRYPNYAGLNQINRSYLPAGVALEDYRTWSASAQMRRVVSDFMKRQIAYYGKSPRSAGVLYGLNFLPGIVKARGDAPGTVLASANSDPNRYYAANRGLDFDKDGQITIADLDAVVASKWKAPIVQDAARRLYAVAPAGYVPPADLGRLPDYLGPAPTGIDLGLREIDRAGFAAVAGLLAGYGLVLAYKKLERGRAR